MIDAEDFRCQRFASQPLGAVETKIQPLHEDRLAWEHTFGDIMLATNTSATITETVAEQSRMSSEHRRQIVGWDKSVVVNADWAGNRQQRFGPRILNAGQHIDTHTIGPI